jgi:hypothetical protein
VNAIIIRKKGIEEKNNAKEIHLSTRPTLVETDIPAI